MRAVAKFFLAGTMISIMVAVGLGVFFRYVLDSPLYWTDELSRYALVWMTFIGGAALVGSKNGHAKLDIFVERMPPKNKRAATFLAILIETAVLVLVFVGSCILISKSSASSSPAMGLPMVVVYSVIPITALFSLYRIVMSFRKTLNGE
jgi:TRAP-type C4-dicarboxylate transport system permease small subunit